MTREHVVQALITAAYEAMSEKCTELGDVSAGEVLSASLTMTQRAVIYARDNGGNIDAVRAGVEQIWRELPAERAS